jgi:hypothetical protein
MASMRAVQGSGEVRSPPHAASTLARITERSGVTVGRHLLPFAGVGMPSRSGATHVIRERSGVTVGRHLLPFAGVAMPSPSGATHVIIPARLKV